MRNVHLCGEVWPHPGHVCAFFDSRDQKYDVLVPFLNDAIAVGDDVINIVDERDRAAHLETLSEGGEARVNEFLPDFECTLLCVYDLARIPTELLTDILATHPSANINGKLRKNSHYVEPHEYLDMLRDRRRR